VNEKLKILILEDFPEDAKLMEKELNKDGFSFVSKVVSRKEDFINEIEESEYDIILVDYTIPGFDGMKAISLVKEHTPDTPVIIVTGSIDEETAVRCIKEGATDYVLKDNILHLGQAVNSALKNKKINEEKKRIENKLKTNEKKYRTLFNSANDAIILHELIEDGMPGKFIDVNNVACKRLGYSKEEFMELSVKDINAPEEIDRVPEIMKEILKKGSITFEMIHITKDGKRIPVEVSSHVFELEGKNVVLSIARDITECKNAENELKREKNLLRTLINNFPYPIYVKDKNSRFLECNPATAWAFDKENPEDIIGKTDFDFLPKQKAQNYYNKEQEIIKTGTPIINEEDFDIDSGKWIVVSKIPLLEPDNKVKGIIGFNYDITKLKKAEEVLQRDLKINKALAELSNELLKPVTSLEDITNTILFTSMELTKSRHGFISYIDQETGRSIGHTLTEMKNKNCRVPNKREYIEFKPDKNGKYRGLWGYSLNTGKAFYTNSPEKHKASEGFPEGHIEIKKFLSVPASVDGRLIGQIALANSEKDYDIYDLDIVKRFAEFYALACRRLKSEEALKESEEKYRNLFENITSFVFTLDLKGSFTDVNKAAERISGYKKDELIGMNFRKYIEKKHQKTVIESFRNVYKTGKAILNLPVKAKIKSGKIRHFEISLSPILRKSKIVGFQGVGRDVTKQKKIEEELKRSEQKYRTLTENINIGLYRTTPDRNGRFIEVNNAFVKMFGYENKESLINIDVINIYKNPEDREKFNEKMHKQGYIINEEVELKRKDGTVFIASDSCVAVKNEIGEILYYDGNIEDITERKQIEQMLIQSEKMASLGTIAAGVAHEINNPMGYITSNLKVLEKYRIKLSEYCNKIHSVLNNYFLSETEDKKKLAENIKKINNEMNISYVLEDISEAISESTDGAKKVRKIVMDLKDFSRPDKSKMETSDINEGIQKSLNVIWNELKYKAEVIKELGDIPPIKCDIQKLNQVFVNILINAVQAIEKKGKIRIKTFTSNNSVVIKISDTGKGISKNDKDKIFDAFYTTKEPGKGTGLGLAISYRIIEEHNGTIDVESEPGKGTTFTIKLPLAESKKIKKQKVLIVDDDRAFSELLMKLLNKYELPLSIRIAKDGFEAADLISIFKPDIVFLDIFMPGLDGFEICRKIKSSKLISNAKIIMVTGFDEADLESRSFEAGADEFIRKPLRKKTLYDLLDKVLNNVQ